MFAVCSVWFPGGLLLHCVDYTLVQITEACLPCTFNMFAICFGHLFALYFCFEYLCDN